MTNGAVELLTVVEVADRLRVSRRTVERLLKPPKGSPRLRSLKVGRRRLVKTSELAAYIAHQQKLEKLGPTRLP